MATTLTEEYLDSHMQYIEIRAQKVGRKIAEMILNSAKEDIKRNGETEVIKLEGTFKIKAFEDICVDVQICLPFVGCSSVHIGA